MPPPDSLRGAPSPWRWWVAALLLSATTINYLDRVALNQTASDIKTVFAGDPTVSKYKAAVRRVRRTLRKDP